MLRFILRQLLHDPVRTALTITAMAAVVAVILVLEGFNEGLLAQLRSAVINRDADLIVTQAGVSNMTATRSILPQFARRDVEAVEGVAAADPLTGISMIYRQGDRRAPVSLLVFDTGGGPSRLLAGSGPKQVRDIVIDQSLADKFDLEIGQPFILSDFEFKISGIAQGAAAFFTPFAFIRYDDLIDFYLQSDVAADITTFPMLSFLLLELKDNVDRQVVARRIEEAVPSVDVFTPEALAENDKALGNALMGPIFRFMIDVAYVIGILVTGIIMFSAVNARRHDFGVLKALGFSHGFLSLSVVIESLILALVAIPLGIFFARFIAAAFEAAMPLYLILASEPLSVIRTAVACLVFAVLGALAPIHIIRRLDPGLVFRS